MANFSPVPLIVLVIEWIYSPQRKKKNPHSLIFPGFSLNEKPRDFFKWVFEPWKVLGWTILVSRSYTWYICDLRRTLKWDEEAVVSRVRLFSPGLMCLYRDCLGCLQTDSCATPRLMEKWNKPPSRSAPIECNECWMPGHLTSGWTISWILLWCSWAWWSRSAHLWSGVSSGNPYSESCYGVPDFCMFFTLISHLDWISSQMLLKSDCVHLSMVCWPERQKRLDLFTE